MQQPAQPQEMPASIHVSDHAASLANRFPVEILYKIFSDVLRFPPSSLLSPIFTLHQANLALLDLTAVCSHWRSAALEYATLWNTIAFSTSVRSTIQCAALFLVRSKEAMLSVYIMDSGYPRDRETTLSCRRLLKAISSQSHRFLTCDFSPTSHSFWNYWSFPAPKLRKLTIQGLGTESTPIFRGQSPSLESITLLQYSPWPLSNYPSLRQVDLRNRGRNVSLSSLLHALGGCEALEELALHEYANLSNEAPQLPITPLPRLFKVNFFSCDAALILEHLETPSLEGPVVIFDSKPGEDILHSLPRNQHMTPPYLQGITELHVVLCSYSGQYCIAGHREDGSIALYIGVCGVNHWSRWTWVRASIAAVASFAHFFSTQNLVFSTDTPCIPWGLWLPNLNSLKELTVSCPRSDGLLETLLKTSPRTRRPLCPLLQSLALYQCGGCAVVDHVGLIRFVISRYGTGQPLRKLKLHKDEWNWIQQLDDLWAALAQSQSTEGDNVFVDLPIDIDVEALRNKRSISERSDIVNRYKASFYW